MSVALRSCYAELRWYAECCVCMHREELPRGSRSGSRAHAIAIENGWVDTGKPWLLKCPGCALTTCGRTRLSSTETPTDDSAISHALNATEHVVNTSDDSADERCNVSGADE